MSLYKRSFLILLSLVAGWGCTKNDDGTPFVSNCSKFYNWNEKTLSYGKNSRYIEHRGYVSDTAHTLDIDLDGKADFQFVLNTTTATPSASSTSITMESIRNRYKILDRSCQGIPVEGDTIDVDMSWTDHIRIYYIEGGVYRCLFQPDIRIEGEGYICVRGPSGRLGWIGFRTSTSRFILTTQYHSCSNTSIIAGKH